jgi:pimeloyl-ACP methyl ester carboxylesterase
VKPIPLAICALALLVVATSADRVTGPRLAGAHACPGEPGFTCSTLAVPLDYSGRVKGTLRLAVAAGPSGARGVLLVLTGGPGQPGVPFIARLAGRLGDVAGQYRVVTVDQRGTGGAALQCPALQRQMGYSDLQPPTPAAVRGCAASIGPKRAFYGTDETVRDLDRLRHALGAERMAIDGTSYGTYVAERYALAYPGHVSRLVLDSVVPHEANGQLETEAFPRTAQVLRAVCRAEPCPGDPAADLAADVARYHNGPALLDAVVAISLFDPTFRSVFNVPYALNEARRGNTRPMDAMLAGIRASERSTAASVLSQGLHASALCSDWLYPWGSSAAPLAGRAEALGRYAARLPEHAFWPFDRATVSGNGIMQQCLYWPPTPPGPEVRPGTKILAPTLVLAGDRDLSTPLPWPRAELKLLPRAKLVVVHGMGHSTQRSPQAQAAVRAFLLGG